MSRVCTKCFQDKIAQRFIKKNGTIGSCDFCESKQRKVIEANKLRGLFEEVVSLYGQYDPPPGSESWMGGATLSECLQDWEIFSEDNDEKTQNEILDEIMGFDPRDGDISASEDWQETSDHWATMPTHHQWPWFANYLKQIRRFIIEEDPSGDLVRPETWVPDLLSDAGAIRVVKRNSRLFRGRLGFVDGSSPPRGGRLPLSAGQMGAPPARLARAGRANPEGIAFLYCALEADTAIIETGRFPGAVVSLRELRLRKQLRLADLTGSKSILEPLATPDLATEVRRHTLLGSLGDALGKPIHPEDSGVEYVPTQYLAEVIQSAGYNGICFSSALRPKGTNVVVFDPVQVRVTRRAWVFELGRAKYDVHPNPRYIVNRRRMTKKLALAISSMPSHPDVTGPPMP